MNKIGTEKHTHIHTECTCVSDIYKLILGPKIFGIFLRKYDKAAINLWHVI